MSLVHCKLLMAKAYRAFGPMDQGNHIIYLYSFFTYLLRDGERCGMSGPVGPLAICVRVDEMTDNRCGVG